MKNKLAAIGAAVTVLATPALAYAQIGQRFNEFSIENLRNALFPFQPTTPPTFTSLVASVLNFFILIAAVIAIVYLIWAGIQYITASTDETKAKNARMAIYNAIIGIVVIILSYSIIFFISSTAQTELQRNFEGTGSLGPGFDPRLYPQQ